VDENWMTLRRKLKERLRAIIRKPEVEAKELAAFDIVMSRRKFLKTSQFAVIGGLIAAGTPPTLWGRRDSALAVEAAQVGLTLADTSSVTAAATLTMGTELFPEPVYSRPVISPEQLGSHALIEGPQGRHKVQSLFGDSDPLETTWLDTDAHFGTPELIQLEDVGTDSSGNTQWELAHYRQAWNPRGDGVTTDGQVREVIMGPKTSDAPGLVSPTQVLAIGARWNNQFDSSGSSEVTYLVIVVDTGVAQGTGGGFAILGTGQPMSAGERSADHPVQWAVNEIGAIVKVTGNDFVRRATTYTDLSIRSDSGGVASFQSIVLYLVSSIVVLTLDDMPAETGGRGIVCRAQILPKSQPANDWSLTWIAETRGAAIGYSEVSGSGAAAKATIFQTLSEDKIVSDSTKAIDDAGTLVRLIEYDATSWRTGGGSTITGEDATLIPDFSTLVSSHRLYTVQTTDSDPYRYHVHIGAFETFVALYVSVDNVNTEGGFLGGMVPVTLASDASGDQAPVTFSGGMSKFGGFRFVLTNTASSAAGSSLFIMRQQRQQPDAANANPPYLAPIFGENDAQGNPRPSGYSSTTKDATPSVLADSVAANLDKWVGLTGVVPDFDVPVYNVLLNAIAAFSTGPSSTVQASWLGEGFQAVYAPTRFAWDSGHIAITKAQSSSADAQDYAAYLMTSNPVTKTWHKRQIATQVLPQDPGENETGDHYQLSIGMANVYGQTVRMSDNPDMSIEVRGDAPTTVTDTTNNYYYQVDRYTSFFAAPDTANNRLELVVKASTLAVILYARLVDTSTLQPSGSDAAMLTGSNDTSAGWQSVNVSAQAQARMGTGASTSLSDLLGDDAPVADPTSYVNKTTLANKMNGDDGSAPWSFKSGFSSSTADLTDNLAGYLNASGTNLAAASASGNLSASEGEQIDPLVSVTSVVNGSLAGTASISTTFTYATGTDPAKIDNTNGSAVAAQELGSIWSSISHALHDALHWLHHAETETINALGSATVTLIQDADQITAKVDADIMKAVNGVDNALEEVVSTVEEYGSILVNVVVSIVEESFIYIMIEEIIALISMFLHFEKMLDLKKSLENRLGSVLGGTFEYDDAKLTVPPTLPDDYSTYGLIEDFLPGGSSAITAPTSPSQDTLPASVLTAIINNPIVKKILNWILKGANEALSAAASELPIKFSMSDVDNVFEEDVEQLIEAFEDTFITDLTTLVEQLLVALVNPEGFYDTMVGDQGLQALFDQLVDTPLKTMLDDLDDLARGPTPPYADVLSDLLGQEGFVELNIKPLADFIKLFGADLGSVSNGRLELKGADMVLLPLAILLWTTAYMRDGVVISSVAQLDGGSDALAVEASTAVTLWDAVNLGASFVLSELSALAWLITAETPKTDLSAGQRLFLSVTSWLGVINRVNKFTYSIASQFTGQSRPAGAELEIAAAVVKASSTVITSVIKLNGYVKGDKDSSEAAELFEVGVHVTLLGVEAYELVEDGEKKKLPASEILAFVGRVMTVAGSITKAAWKIWGKEAGEAEDDDLQYFAAVIFGAPYGYLLQEVALALTSDDDDDDDDDDGDDTGGGDTGGDGSGGDGSGDSGRPTPVVDDDGNVIVTRRRVDVTG